MSISNDTTTYFVFIQITITIQKQQLYHIYVSDKAAATTFMYAYSQP